MAKKDEIGLDNMKTVERHELGLNIIRNSMKRMEIDTKNDNIKNLPGTNLGIPPTR